MPKDPERQDRLASRLKESKAHPGLFDRLFYRSDQPWELGLIHADGSRHAIEPNTPIWVLPGIILAIGAGIALFIDDPLGTRILVVAIFASLAIVVYLKQAWTERLLWFDAQRRSLLVHRGRRVLVEIPFDDIDEIFVEVRADEVDGDAMRAVASIGSASLPLTMWTTEDPATTAAKAVGELMGIAREPTRRPET